MLEARYHQATAKVAIMVGTMIASMMTSESNRITFSEPPTGPCGSSMPDAHDDSPMATMATSAARMTFDATPVLTSARSSLD